MYAFFFQKAVFMNLKIAFQSGIRIPHACFRSNKMEYFGEDVLRAHGEQNDCRSNPAVRSGRRSGPGIGHLLSKQSTQKVSMRSMNIGT